MGNHNLEPATVLNTGQQLATPQELNTEEKIWITSLHNANYYCIDCAFIQKLKEGFQLVVIPKVKEPLIKQYPTYRGCRIAFAILFKKMAFNETIKPGWTDVYCPDKKWLEEKQRRLDKYFGKKICC